MLASLLRLTVQEDPTAGGGANRHVGMDTVVLCSVISGSGAAVAIGVRSRDLGAVEVRTTLTPFVSRPNQWRLNFFPSNWNVLQTVTVMAPTNADNPDLTFVVTPTLPAGLRYGPPMKDAVSGAYELGGWIIGTPREATPQRQYTLTVGGAQGNEAELLFALAAEAAPPPPPEPEPTDRQPTFGGETVKAQTWTVGSAVTLALPAATGGRTTRMPTEGHSETTYTLTATDAEGRGKRAAGDGDAGAGDGGAAGGGHTVGVRPVRVRAGRGMGGDGSPGRAGAG